MEDLIYCMKKHVAQPQERALDTFECAATPTSDKQRICYCHVPYNYVRVQAAQGEPLNLAEVDVYDSSGISLTLSDGTLGSIFIADAYQATDCNDDNIATFCHTADGGADNWVRFKFTSSDSPPSHRLCVQCLRDDRFVTAPQPCLFVAHAPSRPGTRDQRAARTSAACSNSACSLRQTGASRLGR